jgi:FecR protein
MRGHRLFVSLLALVMGAGTALAQAPATTALVRLSFVQGQVKVLEGETTHFDHAQANMPLLAGYTLSTGESGQAEVEFTDGSVARLTPNSQLRLDKLPSADERNEATELTMVSGLGYFELNTANGQRFNVHFNAAEAQPVGNSIFRISLDDAPDLSVFVGTVRASMNGAFDRTVEEGRSLHFDANDDSNVTTASIQSDTWDQWNQDRDTQIAQQAQQQTSARETSGATNEPGWDDLDAYGDWYPVEGYGNVWAPNNAPSGWDPYGNGYWANYPGWGYTWISGYPWGWLPYHCGAWNYWNSFGWGWVPGQCGLGWQPMVTIWNAPRGYRPPPRPIPGGHIGPPSVANRLVGVNRGPALPNRGVINHHTQPVRIDGQRVDPLPVLENPTAGGRFSYRGTHTPPVGRSSGFTGNGGNGVRVMPPASAAGTRPPTVAPTRPVFRPAPLQPSRPVLQPSRPVMTAPQRITPPAPRPMAPAPRMSPPPSPRMYSPPPAPRMSSPAPAPRMSSPPPAGHMSAGPSGHR